MLECACTALKGHLCSSLTNSTFSDVMLLACNQSWWEYFHHGNWQTQQIRASPPPTEPVVKHLPAHLWAGLTVIASDTAPFYAQVRWGPFSSWQVSRAFYQLKSFTGLGLDCFGSISHFRFVCCGCPNNVFPRGTGLPSLLKHKRSQPIREEFEAQDAGHCCKEKIQRKVNLGKLNTMKEE